MLINRSFTYPTLRRRWRHSMPPVSEIALALSGSDGDGGIASAHVAAERPEVTKKETDFRVYSDTDDGGKVDTTWGPGCFVLDVVCPPPARAPAAREHVLPLVRPHVAPYRYFLGGYCGRIAQWIHRGLCRETVAGRILSPLTAVPTFSRAQPPSRYRRRCGRSTERSMRT